MTKDELAALDAAATPGTLIHKGWGDGSTVMGMTNIFNEDAEALLMECIPEADAAFLVELWNSYRSGQLVLKQELDALIEERDRLRLEVAGADQRAAFAESRLHAFRQIRAARAKTLAEFVKARAPELWPDYAAVSVNGALYDEDGFHPNYEREMNILRHRAEKAEEGLAEARAALAGDDQ